MRRIGEQERLEILMYGPGGNWGLPRYIYDLSKALSEKANIVLATGDDCDRPGGENLAVKSIWRTPTRYFQGRPSKHPITEKLVKLVLHTKRNASLLRFLARNDYSFDLLHCQFFMPLIDWPSLLAASRRLPVVFTVHNVNFQNPLVRGLDRIEEWLLKRVLLSSAGLIVHSSSLVSSLRSYLQVFEGPIGCIPHGLPKPVASATEPSWLAELRPVLRGKLVLLQFGGIRPVKGVEVLLAALRSLPAGIRDDVHLVIVGKADRRYPDYGNECRRLIQGHELCRTVTWVDRYISDEDIPWVFACADLAVFPYRNYLSASGALSWAYACQVPVLAADVGALGEYVKQDRTGLCFRSADFEDLAACIMKIRSDRCLLAAFRKNLADPALLQRYDWRRCAALTETFYRNVLDSSSSQHRCARQAY